MLLFDEIPQPLMFYDELEKQQRFHRGYERHLHHLLVQHDRLLPFQIRFGLDESVSAIAVMRMDGSKVYDLDPEMLRNVALEDQDFNYYLWTADSPLQDLGGIDISLECGGQYYLRISTEFGEYFSEVFAPVVDIEKYLLLEWSDDHDVDPAHYNNDFGFRFRLFVDTFITKGLPIVVVESEEDGHGEIVDISRKVNITYDIDFGVVPNYLYEAIAFMAIHRDVTITTPKYLREGNIKSIALEDAQIEGLPYWHLTMNFQQGRYFYNTACGNDIKPVEIEEYLIDQGATAERYDSFVEQQDLS